VYRVEFVLVGIIKRCVILPERKQLGPHRWQYLLKEKPGEEIFLQTSEFQ